MIAALQPVSGPGVLKSVPPCGRVIENTSENKARRTYQNVQRVLKAARLDFPRVLQVRCYRANQNDRDAHNRIYGQFFSEPVSETPEFYVN